MAFRPLIDFRGFRPLAGSELPLASVCCRKRQKSIKVGHSSVTIFRGRALLDICDNQQNTHGPLIIRKKRNAADARHGGVVLGRRTTPCAFNPRSRVSALLVVARGCENTRVWLIVAGNRRSATTRGRNGKWPTFCGLRRFASNLKPRSTALNYQ